jgi:mannosylglycerate hydrolase
VPTILDSNRIQFYAHLKKLPALGYRAYRIRPEAHEPRCPRTLLTGPNAMENEFLRVKVSGNGTAGVICKKTGRKYEKLNYLTDQGECGNAWKHAAPRADRKLSSLGVSARVQVVESGPLVAAIRADYEFHVPADHADGTCRSEQLVELPVSVEYRLEAGSCELGVTLTVDNRARDHWLRANFPTGLRTDVTWADSHFDVLSRPIPIPDSTGWVEPACGTHPLRTFVALSDGKDGLALLPKGLYEYEAFEDEKRTLALTLLRCCRIKLVVSEEKQTELPDPGVQCPGVRRFEYAVSIHPGDWRKAGLLSAAARRYAPPRAAMTGRGKGALPHEASLLAVSGAEVHVTCVKRAEDGRGLLVRLFNPLAEKQTAALAFGRKIVRAELCTMDERAVAPLPVRGDRVRLELGPKKIATVRAELG